MHVFMFGPCGRGNREAWCCAWERTFRTRLPVDRWYIGQYPTTDKATQAHAQQDNEPKAENAFSGAWVRQSFVVNVNPNDGKGYVLSKKSFRICW